MPQLTFDISKLDLQCGNCHETLKEIHGEVISGRYPGEKVTARVITWCPVCKTPIPLMMW